MTDLEPRLRHTLSDALDPVAADPVRAPAAIRRARRGRALRGAAAGLAGLLLVAGAATAWERQADDRRPPPAGEPADARTFALDFDAGDGTLTVDVPKAQACFDLPPAVPGFRAQLRYDPDGPDDPVIATVGTDRAVPRCTPVDRNDAARVLAEPRRHYVSFAPDLTGWAAALEPLDLEPEFVPDLVQIVCSQDGAVALTPQVQPRLDGVHVRIYNQGGAWKEFNLTSPEEGGSSGADLPRKGVLDNALNLAPGSYSLGCFRATRDIPYSDPRHPDYTTFAVVDPYEMWNDPELDCVDGDQRREVVTDDAVRRPSRIPDFDELIREHVPGVLPSDVLERPTYPESAAKAEPRTLIRDGRKIASLYLSLDRIPGSRRDYLWSIVPVVCPGSRIAPP